MAEEDERVQVVVGALVIAALFVAVWQARVVLDRPPVGFLWLAALAPFDGVLILFDLPRFVAGWKEGLVLGVFVLSFVQRGRYERPSIPRWAGPMAALVGVAVLSALANPTFGAVLGLKVGFFYLLVPAALWFVPMSEVERDRLVSILMATGVVVAVVGLAQQVAGASALVALGYDYNVTVRFAGSLLRSFSTFNQPFAFAFHVMMVLLVGIPVALDDRRRRRNVIFMACLPILLLGLGSAVVRAALLGLALGGAWLGVHRYRIVGHAVAPLVIAAVLLPSGTAGAAFSSSSLFERTAGWVDVVVDEGVEPFGRGIGSVGSVAEKLESGRTEADATFPSPPDTDRYQPDNYYVKTLVELGPVGLWLLVLALVFAMGSTWRASVLGSGRDTGFAAGVTAATLAAMTAALVSAYWEIFPSDAMFWLLLGVLPSITSTSTPSLSSREEVEYRPTLESSSTNSTGVSASV